jgi:hypothetical protein
MKTDWRTAIFWTSLGAAIVVNCLSIGNTKIGSSITQLGAQTIAPTGLQHSLRVLESGIKANDSDFPVERLVTNRAYQHHFATLAAYSERLELYAKNEFKRSSFLSELTLISSIMMFASVFVNFWKRKKPA